LSDHARRIMNHPSTVRANTTSDDVPTPEIVVPGGGQLSATKRIPVQVAAPKLSAAEPNDGAHGGADQLSRPLGIFRAHGGSSGRRGPSLPPLPGAAGCRLSSVPAGPGDLRVQLLRSLRRHVLGRGPPPLRPRPGDVRRLRHRGSGDRLLGGNLLRRRPRCRVAAARRGRRLELSR